jgi:hypothetical protein
MSVKCPNCGTIFDPVAIEITPAGVVAPKHKFPGGSWKAADGSVTYVREENASPDPRTNEQNAFLASAAVPGTGMPRQEFRGRALTPKGELVSVAEIDVPYDITAYITAGTSLNKPSGGYLFCLDIDGHIISIVGCFPSQAVLELIVEQPDKTALPQAMIDALVENAPFTLKAGLKPGKKS